MSDFSLMIDNLNIRLPDAFSGRANSIARLTAKKLAEKTQHLPAEFGNLAIKNIAVPALTLSGRESNTVVAKKIASAIGQQIVTQATNQGVSTEPKESSHVD